MQVLVVAELVKSFGRALENAESLDDFRYNNGIDTFKRGSVG